MSKQLNRKIVKINNRTSLGQQFTPVMPQFKAHTEPSILSWASRGRGVEGESYNSSDSNGFRQIINKRRKPM